MGDVASIAEINDVRAGYVGAGDLVAAVDRGSAVILRGRKRNVAVGRVVPIKINTNIGISHWTPRAGEQGKIEFLSESAFGPDLVMDHTIDPKEKNFWRDMVETFAGPVGTLPQYTAYSPRHGLLKEPLLERIEEMLEGGVAFMTLHFTSDMDIYEIAAKSRAVPVTSRGGGLAIRTQLKKGQRINAFREGFDDIAKLFLRHEATVSVGTTFRPADIAAGLDEAHRLETARQIEIVRELRSRGVSCLMEGVGHLAMDQIAEYCDLIAEADCPFMPLGPMVTDSSIGFDHVTNAIGGAIMAFLGGASVLNSVTREEHTGGVPTTASVIEGLKAARVAAHAVNLTRFPQIRKLDELTLKQRGAQVSCVVSGGLFGEGVAGGKKGCTRCDFECPIILAPAAL
ncbi:phosphomethylpyrimidine synthase ThiC [Micromonospora aurantiaca]|uniref:phosphomethylpyrimidine synthase ThiC n=1 Tax=Micromonospora TaxID=1873 RepID=UPI001B39AAD9|nr:phosphomethylpyrimidine synthase ThiC [Micromonospora sp. C41]MBQ1061976.1 phosphomethylpyrimidine synthase ThiC [Micromonospora sp. C41]